MFIFKNISLTPTNPSSSRKSYLSAGGAGFDPLLGTIIYRITSSESSSYWYETASSNLCDLRQQGKALDHGAPQVTYELDLSAPLIGCCTPTAHPSSHK